MPALREVADAEHEPAKGLHCRGAARGIVSALLVCASASSIAGATTAPASLWVDPSDPLPDRGVGQISTAIRNETASPSRIFFGNV